MRSRAGIGVAFAVLASLLAATSSEATTAATTKVAVVMEEPQAKEHDSRVLGAVTSAFLDSQRFEVIERSRVAAVMKEQDFQSFIGDEAQRLGRLVGADYLALASYSIREKEEVTTYTLRARVVSVSTGQVRATVDSQPSLIDRLGAVTIDDAGRKLTESIKDQFPVEGYVIKIDGDEVIVDLGKSAGIQKGDALSILRIGEPIVHPVTGETIPGEERLIGTLKVLTVTETTSLCKLKKGESTPELGDRARFRKDKLF